MLTARMDESAETSLWQFVTLLAVVALAVTLGAGVLTVLRRHKDVEEDVRQLQPLTSKEAWAVDPEKGDSYVQRSEKPDLQKQSAALIETLRDLLQDEVLSSLQRSDVCNRLDRLEQKAMNNISTAFLETTDTERSVLSGALLSGIAGSNALPNGVASPTAAGSLPPDLPEWPSGFPPPAPPPKDVSPPPRVDIGIMTECEQMQRSLARKLSGCYGLVENSRKGARMRKAKGLSCFSEGAVDPLRETLTGLTKELHDKDFITSKLTKKLRESQQSLWRLTLDERGAKKQLKDLLCDTTFVPADCKAVAQEIQVLHKEIEDLSSRLADVRGAEMQWSLIAKRQRAYFAQSERQQQENVTVFKKHPAGEIFLVQARDERKHHVSPQRAHHDPISDEDVDGSDVDGSGEDVYDGDLSPFESEDEHTGSPLELRIPTATHQDMDTLGDQGGRDVSAHTARSL